MRKINLGLTRARVRVTPVQHGDEAPVVNENTVRPEVTKNMGDNSLLEIPAKIMAVHTGRSFSEARQFLAGLCTGYAQAGGERGDVSVGAPFTGKNGEIVDVWIGSDG